VNSRQKKGIRIKDLTIGIGRGAEPGTVAVIKYQGFLNRGDRVASSDDQPGGEYRFEVGRRDPTAMLESSVIGMREGGTREARVSPHLAYREGTPDRRIPPNAVIRWVIELVRVEDGQVKT
jgi:FKBP-type peptidyl-prolyl cis-trans isomerase